MIGNAFFSRTDSSVLINKSSQHGHEIDFEAVYRQAGQSYSGAGGAYEDVADCRKPRTKHHVTPTRPIVSGTTAQQLACTYSVPFKKVSLRQVLYVCLLKTF